MRAYCKQHEALSVGQHFWEISRSKTVGSEVEKQPSVRAYFYPSPHLSPQPSSYEQVLLGPSSHWRGKHWIRQNSRSLRLQGCRSANKCCPCNFASLPPGICHLYTEIFWQPLGSCVSSSCNGVHFHCLQYFCIPITCSESNPCYGEMQLKPSTEPRATGEPSSDKCQWVCTLPPSPCEEQLIWFVLLFEREPDHLHCK